MIPSDSPNFASQGYPSAAPDGPEHLVTMGFTVPAPTEIVFALAHFHTGALNLSLVLNGETVCTSMPVYVALLLFFRSSSIYFAL